MKEFLRRTRQYLVTVTKLHGSFGHITEATVETDVVDELSRTAMLDWTMDPSADRLEHDGLLKDISMWSCSLHLRKKPMRMKPLYAIVLFFLCVFSAFAQSQLAVELGHPVYSVLETAELRGVIARLSSVKPYTRGQVADYLAAIEARMGAFSPAEREWIANFAAEFAPGTFAGAPLVKIENGKAVAGLRLEATTKADAGGIADLIAGTGTAALKDLWHLNSILAAYIAAAPAPWISVMGEAGYTLDKIEKSLYLPYTFTKEWDAWHLDFTETRSSTGEKDFPTVSMDFLQDIGFSTDTGSLTARFSRFRRDWGLGSGSLSLSGTARPFVGVETAIRPSKYFALSSLVGSLTNWEKQNDEKSTAMADINGDGIKEYSAVSWQKMFGLQRLELFPTDWLTLAFESSMVGAKRFELGYFAPLIYSVMYQNALADMDNLGIQVGGSIQIPKLGKFYGSLYVDEMELTHLDQLFTKARNMFALQGGAKLNLGDIPLLSGLPFATLTAQYTKIEPYVYAHYPTWYPDYRLRVDTSYTNDGENLGYFLPPNSDEFLARLEAFLAPGWKALLQYSFVRHGVSANMGNTVGNYMDYSVGVDTYVKDFLHDGIYQYNHIGKLNFYWSPGKAPKLLGAYIPLELGLGYGLSYTWYEDGKGGGGASLPAYAPIWKNVLELSVKLFL